MRNGYLIFFIFFVFSQVAHANGKLIFSMDVIRHGDRTPIHVIEKMPYPWKEGAGQLTSAGIRQLIALGEKFHKRYIEEENFLSKEYQHDMIYVRSTDYDRTLISAQALLKGLYPHAEFIPIHPICSINDPFLSNETQINQFNTLLEKYVYDSKEWKEKVEKTKPYWEKWSESTGWKIHNLRQLIRLGNSLYIYKLYNVPIVTISNEDVETIIGIYQSGLAEMYKPKEIASLLGKEQLNIISNYLSDANEQKNKLKYVLISAHDSTVLSIMSVLGAPLNVAPPYAANINISLYEDDKKLRKIAVRYNDELISLPECKKTQCSFDEFMTIAKNT